MAVDRQFFLAPGLVAVGALLAACNASVEPPAATDADEGDPASSAGTSVSAEQVPVGRLASDVVPVHYALDLRIDPAADSFSGQVAIDVELSAPRANIWLHGLNLVVTEAYAVDAAGQRVAAAYGSVLDSGVARLALERPIAAGAAVLHMVYSAPFNRSVNALFRVDRGDDAYIASQLEPIAGRQIFPGFDDPQFKTPWDISITTRAEHAAITNSPELAATELDDGWVRHQFATSAPLPTYLLAFAVGPYDVFEAADISSSAVRERPVPLRGVAARGMGPRFGIALDETEAVLTALEDYFGTPYPYAKLDLIAMPAGFGGAMENAGAVAYDEYLILVGDDPPIQQRRIYLSVHAHELAHMWFGDLVTPEWWTDIWLNEAFATWMANKITQTVWPEGEFERATLDDALGAMATDSLAGSRQIREPVSRNETIEESFDTITYEKGGGVLAMFENYLGAEAFRAGVRLHMQRYAHGVANADDFMASLAEGSGREGIEAAFRSFIDQPGVPIVEATLQCPGDAAPTIELRQSRYAPLGSSIDAAQGQWQIPVCIAYDVADAPGRVCELLEDRTATLELDLNECPTAIHPNSRGAGYYRFKLDDAGWAALVARASTLAPAEALTLVDSLDAAFRSGAISAERLVAGLGTLAEHPSWDVASATLTRFTGLLRVLEGDDRERAKPMLRALFRPRYDSLREAGDESSLLLRRALTRFLALDVDDPELRAELASLAREYVGIDRATQTDVPTELATLLTAGVQDLDDAFFDRLLEMAVAADDPYFKETAFEALGRVERAAPAERLRADILARRFPLTDSVSMILGQLRGDATREATWAWIEQNADAVIALVPEFRRSLIVPRFGRAECTAERAAALETFVLAHADALPGYERSLGLSTERIRLCAALRGAKAAELAAAFGKLRPGSKGGQP